MRKAQEAGELLGEQLTLNMGPSHPSTHGVLRIVLELDGEVITKATPDIGYLHRGDEKIAENMQYNQFVPYTDRLDYLAPIANNVAYALAVEKLMGWELPPRGKAIRVICCELARISAHMLGIGAMAMDIGAVTVFLYTFLEREKIYNLVELLSGARFTTSYTRVGGQTRDLPETVYSAVARVSRWSQAGHRGVGQAPDPQSHFHRSLQGRRRDFERGRDCLRHFRSEPARFGRRARRPPQASLSRLQELRFRDSDRHRGRLRSTAIWSAWRKCGKACASWSRSSQKLPAGPVNYVDPKQTLPPKVEVLTKMEELIHHFILVTEGVDAPVGEVYFGAENPKGELGFYICSKGGGVPYRLKIRAPSFVNLSILAEDPSRAHDQRCRHHPGLLRFRDGRVRPLDRSLERGLTWRPVHLAATEKMNMKMGNAFAGMGSVVDNDRVTGLLQSLPLGDCRRREEQMTEQRGVSQPSPPQGAE